MKRRLPIVAIFLLVGAVMNVAEAWWSAFPSPHPSRFTHLAEPSDLAWWETNAPDDFPNLPLELRSLSESNMSGRLIRPWIPNEGKITPDHQDSFTHIRCGWPAHALDGWYWSRGNADAVLSHAFVIREGWLWVPLRPIWPGIVINTLFYAVVVWLVTCGPFAARRLNRIRRGLCPKCEYPMGESAVCTECGKALPARRTSRSIIV